MKRLNESALQIGDIVLTTSTAKVSKSIRRFTRSDISHAMVYVETCSVIDATGEGVHARNTQRLFWDDQCAVHVLRLAEGLTDFQSRHIVDYVRGRIGTQYSRIEAVRSVLGRGRSWSRKQFCSRLVAQAYASADVDLVANAHYCSPQHLKKSARLIEVQDAIQRVTDHPAHVEADTAGTPQRMRDATNALLKGARAKNQQIQDLNDIDRHLMASPGDDGYFVDLYRTSGYLTIWEAEFEENHWQYELPAMIAAPISDAVKRQYCESLVGDREEGLVRFEVNRAGYTILAEEFSLETFGRLKSLYEKLVQLHQQRRQVATQWLSLHAVNPSPAPPMGPDRSLIPHTEEWFAALSAWNAQQAAQTRSMVEQAESLHVCSVCGDEPTRDYRLIEPGIPAGAVCTLRLCNDCWKIRREMYGESLALLT